MDEKGSPQEEALSPSAPTPITYDASGCQSRPAYINEKWPKGEFCFSNNEYFLN